MKINLIVTYSDNFVIAKDNTIPWDYKEDLTYFKKIINNVDSNKKNALIMGHTTYINLPIKKIKNNFNIVITNKNLFDNNEEDLFFVDSIGMAIDKCKNLDYDDLLESIFIIGGEQIYSYFLKSYYYSYLDKVYITRINKKYDGNKFFYGLEDKFYYLSIKTFEENIEYRVLQYDKEFENPEKKYLIHLQKIYKYGVETNNTKQLFNFNLKIDLSKYFPVYSFIKKNKDNLFNSIFLLFKNELINTKVNVIIDKIKNNDKSNLYINLSDIPPLNSIYYFDYNYQNLETVVIHNRGNMLIDVINNILFSSLLNRLISKLAKLKSNIVDYTCMETYYLVNDESNIDKILWDLPDAHPLLNIKNNGQKEIRDFEYNDLIFTGLNI
jgi:dihydrofolate reductase